MASTLTATSFNIKITEEQVVRNSVIKNEVTHTISNTTNVDHRIVTCPNTTSINLFNLNGPNPGAGTFPSSSLQYARITNLDDTYSAAITISGSQGSFTQKLTPMDTIFIVSPNITSSNFNGSFGDNIDNIKVYAISSSIDIEYTLVNA
tara:strand:+ start:3124 stop:3570 length:447 start_codon:yes stop_codon:yes gene_type:complete